jgi:hypothetical protein
MQKLRIGTRVGDRSRGRFATPADSPQHDSPCPHVYVRRERLGFVHRSWTLFCRPMRNLSVTIRSFLLALVSHWPLCLDRRVGIPGEPLIR